MDPKFQQLRAFYHAYHQRSLTRAGETLHLTQSAMSRLVQQLEEVLQIALFDRTAGALRPTEAAEEAIQVVERILSDVDLLKSSLKGLVEKRRGRVRFACTPTMAANLMPDVLLGFQQRWEDVAVTMLDAPPDRLVELVATEAVDFGVIPLGEDRSDLVYTPLFDDHLCVICRADSPLAQVERLTWSALEGQRIIAVDSGQGWPDIVQQTLLAQGLPLQAAYTVAYSATALALTARGFGVAIMPAHMIRGHASHGQLLALALNEPRVPRGLFVLTKARRTLSPASSALVEFLSAQLHHASAG